MIWKIAAKEFLLNLMTFKFVVGTILCIVLVAVFVPVLAEDYRQRLQQYDERVADNEAKLRQVKAYRVLTPTVYRRPRRDHEAGPARRHPQARRVQARGPGADLSARDGSGRERSLSLSAGPRQRRWRML
jgi:hypothetical protein